MKLGTRCKPTCLQPTGMKMAHCSACHNTFANIDDFDLHRTDNSVPEDQQNYCWEPSSVNLLEKEGVWSSEEGHAERKTIADRLEKARNARGNK